MTYQEACEIYVNNTPQARSCVEKIIKYEDGMTVKEFSEKVRCGYHNTTNILKKFNIRINRMNSLEKAYSDRREKQSLLWDENMTISGNAKKIGISNNTANKICSEYNLLYCHHKNIKPSMRKRLNRICELSNMGIKDAEIGRLLGCSGERIRQLKIAAREEGIKV